MQKTDSIHERIKAERLKRRLSDSEVAEKLGISRSTYQYWEKKTPSVDKIRKVAAVLGLPEDYFFVGVDEKTTHEQLVPQGSKGTKDDTGSQTDYRQKYLELLTDNDRFFKSTYAQVLINLEKLYGQSKTLESLVKINLKHTGSVEALARGLEPDQIQEQINNEIANQVLRQKDSNDGIQSTPKATR